MSTISSGPVPHGHPLLTTVGHVAGVVGGGVVLLNLAFGLYAAWFLVVHSTIDALVGTDGPRSPTAGMWGSVIVLGTWLVAVGAVTVWLMRRWPSSLVTAAWLSVPTASVLLPIGIALNASPVAVPLAIGAALVLGVLWLLWRTTRSWEQMLSVTWVAVALAVITVLGIEI